MQPKDFYLARSFITPMKLHRGFLMSFGEQKEDPFGSCRCPVDISGSLIWRVANLDRESQAHGYECPLRECIFQTPLHHAGCCGNDLRTANQIKRKLSQLSPGMQIGLRDGCWNVLKSQYRSLIHIPILHRWVPWKGLIEIHSFLSRETLNYLIQLIATNFGL